MDLFKIGIILAIYATILFITALVLFLLAKKENNEIQVNNQRIQELNLEIQEINLEIQAKLDVLYQSDYSDNERTNSKKTWNNRNNNSISRFFICF